MFLIQLNQNTISLATTYFLLKLPSFLVFSCSVPVSSIVLLLKTCTIESIFLTKGCGTCQQFKIDRSPSHPSFIPVKGAVIYSTICPLFYGFDKDRSDALLVMVDQGLLKGVIVCPTTKTVDMDRIEEFLHENLYKQFGLLDKMLSDRGPQFSAKDFRAMLNRLGIDSVLFTAYHPQTDGTTEQINQEIEAYLVIYCHSHPETWKKAIPTMEFTHNNRQHTDWQRTPFKLMHGDSPKALSTTFENTKFPAINDKIKQLLIDQEEALAAHKLAQTRIAERRKNTFTSFEKGQKVWLDTWNMKMTYHKKMAPKQEGPFK